MARHRGRCRTRKCLEQTLTTPTPVKDAAEKAISKVTSTTLEPRITTVQGEGDRLWRHVLFGTGTCVGMLEGYATLQVPGNDIVPQINVLVERLRSVIKTIEARDNASQAPPYN